MTEASKAQPDITTIHQEQGAARRELSAKLQGRSKKEADRHYQAIADAEVKRIRDSAPDKPPILEAQGACMKCGGGIRYFPGFKAWSHLESADHGVVLR